MSSKRADLRFRRTSDSALGQGIWRVSLNLNRLSGKHNESVVKLAK